MNTFDQVKERHLGRLELYVPVVARVHGGSHPEFHEVRRIYDRISAKIKGAETQQPMLDQEFQQLRHITDNYSVPEDVCESYEAVYDMLAELDRAYHV